MIFNEREAQTRLKWAFESCKNGAWGDEPDGENDTICIRAADFNADLGALLENDRTLRAIDDATYRKVGLCAGDLVIEKSGGGEKQLVGRSVIYNGAGRAVCSNFLARCRPSSLVMSAYLNYLMLAIYKCRGTYPHIKQTTGIQNLDLGSLLNTRVKLPSIQTQKRIAAYLDEKTAQIDGLIDKKRELLDRLAEKRQAIITAAVTKGLDPTVPMKDSGIDWLGQIPAHWEVKRVKHIAKLESGHTPDKKVPEYWESGDIPWVSLNDTGTLRAVDYIQETKFKTTAAGIKNSSARLLPAGAVVFTRDATIGESAITTRAMAVSQHIIAWICSPLIIPEFLLFLIYGMTSELLRLTNGATIGTIGLGDVKELCVCVPGVEEQKLIVEAVFQHKQQITSSLEAVTASIDRLQEYRSALITASVTGQIEALR